jgi:hypothetical protein
MSDSEALDADLDDIPYPGDAPEESTEELDASAEESPETEEETEDVSPTEEGDLDDSDPLDLIPEEYRDLAKKYATKSVGKVQSSWQKKLDETAELRKKAEIVDGFNERFAEDPRAVIETLRRQAADRLEEETAAPGEMPDPLSDPDGFREWYAADVKHRQAQHEQALKARDQEINAIKGNLQSDAARRERATLQQTFGFDDDEMGEFEAEMQRIQADKAYAFQTIADRVKAKKGKVVKKAATKKQVREAVQGEEERSGLPNTGVRAKVAPTGNPALDVLNQLEAEGLVPDDL